MSSHPYAPDQPPVNPEPEPSLAGHPGPSVEAWYSPVPGQGQVVGSTAAAYSGYAPAPPWPAPAVAVGPVSAMPTEPRVYHQMLRGPRFRWWKPIVTLLLAVAMAIPLITLSFLPLVVVGLVSGAPDLESYVFGLDPKNLSPTMFVSVNLSLIVLIPVAGLSIWAVHRIRPGYLSSVAGRLRWRWLGRCVLVILPIWLVYMGLGFLVDLPSSPRPEQWLALLIITLIMTPFQSAAEEYFFRGWIMQNVGAWFRHPIVGLVVSLTISTTVFSVAHGSPDPWILGSIGCLAVAAGIAAWRTGGLEAGIVMHAINNLLAFGAVLTFGGWEEAFVSPETEGTPAIFLLSVGVHAIALSLILWQARRIGLERRYLPQLPATPVSPTPASPENWSPAAAIGPNSRNW